MCQNTEPATPRGQSGHGPPPFLPSIRKTGNREKKKEIQTRDC